MISAPLSDNSQNISQLGLIIWPFNINSVKIRLKFKTVPLLKVLMVRLRSINDFSNSNYSSIWMVSDLTISCYNIIIVISLHYCYTEPHWPLIIIPKLTLPPSLACQDNVWFKQYDNGNNAEGPVWIHQLGWELLSLLPTQQSSWLRCHGGSKKVSSKY